MVLSHEAIVFTLKRIADVAFPKKDCCVVFDDVPMLVVDKEITVRFMPVDDSAVDCMFSGKACFSNVKSFDDKVTVKVFSQEKDRGLFSMEDKVVNVHFDMITISFLMLSRFEETLVSRRDKYGRFRYDDSLCFKYECVDIPIVDEYAMLLRKFVSDNFPGFVVERRVSVFKPTHDVDFLFRFPNFPKAIKTIAGDLFKRKSLTTSWKSFVAYIKSLRDFREDPYVWAVLELAKVSEDFKLDACFYFKSQLPDDKDCSYNIFSRNSQSCIKYLLSRGIRVGLHGSFESFSDKSLLIKEKNNLESVCGQNVADGRQHFLRFDVDKTTQVWQACDIRHDSTMGFPEREGFRCGTCHPYPLFDIVNNCELQVVEHPLIVMDTTLFQYREMTEKEALGKICQLYDRCLSVEGDFVMLWHNTTMFGELKSWHKNVYMKFLQDLHRF